MITCSSALRLTAAVFLATTVGCSTFERDWEAHVESRTSDALRPAGTEDAPDPAGLWEGTWLSGYNGHSGTLRCILEHVSDTKFAARYKATYAGWLTFEYTMAMTVRHEDDTIIFAGEADLGSMAGGMYTYEGQVKDDEFRSTYNSSADHGTFEMRRTSRVTKKQMTKDQDE
jgi:hypothetical protein